MARRDAALVIPAPPWRIRGARRCAVAPATIPPAGGLTRLRWAAEAMRAVGAEPESETYLERVRAWREDWRHGA